ncbi:hypothetical protein ACFY5D_05075 [Paeniglutamicibacter sp. NPDC012692]|uniref:hypothetical protein n=1 Tax=Paeniglutamicibacter sp. NPDC012692 TaxID=3364388 RepID=UPI00369C3234
MRFEGILPENAPDPRIEQARLLKLMPIPVMGLVPQPALEEMDTVGLQSSEDDRGYSEMSASLSYTLWRNPNDHSDPINLADIDEEQRNAHEYVPPWPRPAWLVEHLERLRYPLLWAAVQTSWHRDPSKGPSVDEQLVDHVNYILMNQFRQERGLSGYPWDKPAPDVTVRAVNHRVKVLVDGVEVPAAEIDTDPFVYGIGAELHGGGVVTAVIPRAELGHVRIEFATRA